MIDRYVAYIRRDPESDYGVEFPDLPGCVTAGSTIDEALAMAEDALAGHLSVMADQGDPIPRPRSLKALSDDPNRGDATVVLVPVALSGDHSP